MEGPATEPTIIHWAQGKVVELPKVFRVHRPGAEEATPAPERCGRAVHARH